MNYFSRRTEQLPRNRNTDIIDEDAPGIKEQFDQELRLYRLIATGIFSGVIALLIGSYVVMMTDNTTPATPIIREAQIIRPHNHHKDKLTMHVTTDEQVVSASLPAATPVVKTKFIPLSKTVSHKVLAKIHKTVSEEQGVWGLYLPPGNAKHTAPDAFAPLSHWSYQDYFDSRRACEKYRLKIQTKLSSELSNDELNIEEQQDATYLASAWAVAICVKLHEEASN